MPIKSLPGADSNTTNLPNSPYVIEFEGFTTLNTKPSRPAIQDQEMNWCDGMMPIGVGNLRALPGQGTGIYTSPSGTTIEAFYYFYIDNYLTGANSYCFIIFLSNGGAQIMQLFTNIILFSFAPGTFNIGTYGIPKIAQWGIEYLLIASAQPNGYYIWDGVNIFTAGTLTPNVHIQADGGGYSSTPTIVSYGPYGATAGSFSPTITGGSITNILVTSPGNSYVANESAVLAFTGGGNPGGTAIATVTISNGQVTAATVAFGGAGYTSTTQVTFIGGDGVGATGTVTVSGGSVTGITITSGGIGYYLIAPIALIQDPNNDIAVAYIDAMPFGVQGSNIETFQGRVWLVDVANMQFSAPGDPTDFSVGDGAGAFTSTDSFLRAAFTGVKQTNGFLYTIADSSVNYISGVSTSGTPPITTFSNLNVDPQIGTVWPDSIAVYSRAIIYANEFGIHALYGGSVQKISAPMDGLYATVGQAIGGSNFKPSAAIAEIYGIHVYMLLIPVIDPTTNTARNILMMWDGQHWWTSGQDSVLTFITYTEVNSVLVAYGTDSRNIVQLFSTPSEGVTKTVRSKLWKYSVIFETKNAIKISGLFQFNSTDNPGITVSIDTDQGSSVFVANTTQLSITSAGYVNFDSDIEASGSLIGITMQTTKADFVLLNLTLQAQGYSIRT